MIAAVFAWKESRLAHGWLRTPGTPSQVSSLESIRVILITTFAFKSVTDLGNMQMRMIRANFKVGDTICLCDRISSALAGVDLVRHAASSQAVPEVPPALA